MQKNEQEKDKRQRLTLRVSVSCYRALQKAAKKRQQSLSAYVRSLVERGLLLSSQEKEEAAKHQALAEIVYLVRVIAKACEPDALAQARAYAQAQLQIKHRQEKKEEN